MGRNYSVMLVDDEEDVIRAIMHRIDWEEIGLSVPRYAHNGLEALEMAEEDAPDIVMTDIKMPYMDGLELSRKLKEQYPDRVRIIKEPEENDGCIYCELPTEWFTIRVPRKVDLTDEQRQELSDRMKRLHEHGRVRDERTGKLSHLPLSAPSDV